MKAPTIALLTRTMRTDARSFVPYAGRLAMVGIVFFILLFIGLEMSSRRSGAPGLSFFTGLSSINFWAITIAALSYFSSAITEEKEEMTLGLLKMTGMNPISILLGKSTCRLISTVLLLAAQLPFTMLAITFGGISMSQIVATYVALLAYLIFASNLALFFSVITPRTGHAAFFTGLTLVVFFIAPSIAKAFLWSPGTLVGRGGGAPLPEGGWGIVANVAIKMGEASALQRMGFVLSSAYLGGVMSFQVVTNTLAGLVFFGAAWTIFNQATRTQKESSPTRFGAFRRARTWRIFAVGKIWSQPLMWKDYYFLTGGNLMAAMRVAVVFACVLGIVGMGWFFFDEPLLERVIIGGCLFFFALGFMGLDLAVCASRVFNEEIRWKTLPSLIALPKSSGAMAWQKVKGCLMAQVPYVGCALLGMLIVPDYVAEFLFKVVLSLEGLSSLVLAASYYVFFLYLTTYLSLILNRGALAVAFLICTFGVLFVSMFFSFFFAIFFSILLIGGPSTTLVAAMMISVATSVFVVLSVVMHLRIGPRLEMKAGQL